MVNLLKKLLNYLNPLRHLGDTHYSIVFPALINLAIIILSEVYAYHIAKSPMIVGAYIIFINVSCIMYFAFREGIRGGIVSVIGAIGYYFYIIFSRNYSGQQLQSALEATAVLMIMYLVLGAVIGWLKQSIDKLVIKESDGKRRLEAIIEQLPVGVLITDNNGKLIQRNRRIDTILGVKLPTDFVIGRDVLPDVKINGAPVKPKESPLFQALKTGKEIIDYELVYQRNDGDELDLHINSAPIHNKSHEVIAAASIITDVTKEKMLERQKDEFLGIASHELKTPVTSIKAYGQLLQKLFERKGDKMAVEQLKKMDAQVNKLTNLIRDLLDVTKIQSGRLELNPEEFNFNDLVNEVVDDIQITTQKHHIIRKLNKTEVINADRERIGQVLINLIENAIKYSPHSDEIVVATSFDEGFVKFCVRDYGIGIPENSRSHVFEQFFRGEDPKKNTFPGLGLGLYISSEIVRREQGSIWLEESGKDGSTFCFKLPVKKILFKNG